MSIGVAVDSQPNMYADGKRYVEYAVEICTSLGYQVIAPAGENHMPWDITVNGFRVQVKKRGIDTSKANNIRLKTAIGSGKIAYHSNDVDAFAVFWSSRWFVIPSSFLRLPCGGIGNGIYMPRVMAFADRWSVLEGTAVDYDRQTEFSFWG